MGQSWGEDNRGPAWLPRTSARQAKAAREERAARLGEAVELVPGKARCAAPGCAWRGPLLALDDGATCPQCGTVAA